MPSDRVRRELATQLCVCGLLISLLAGIGALIVTVPDRAATAPTAEETAAALEGTYQLVVAQIPDPRGKFVARVGPDAVLQDCRVVDDGTTNVAAVCAGTEPPRL